MTTRPALRALPPQSLPPRTQPTSHEPHQEPGPEPGPELGPDQSRALLDAVMGMSSDLDLRSVLTRLVRAAAQLTEARYGALGVIGSDGNLSEFITTGIDDRTRARIGPEPRGGGILGQLIHDPRTLRLDDLNAHPAAVGMPAGHPRMTTFLGVPIRIRGTVFGNLYLTEKDNGAHFTAEDEVLVQALAGAAGLVIENARAYGLSERRRQWLEASAQLANALQPPIQLHSALTIVAIRARAAAHAVTAAVVLLPETGPAVVRAVDGVTGPDLEPTLRGVVGEAHSADAQAFAVEVDLGDQYALVVPLRAHLADPGVLVVIFDGQAASAPFEEQEFLAGFADQAGLAIDRAQAVADREELAVVSERGRIARDLHDVVIQRLFATGLKLQGYGAATESSDPAELIESTIGELDATIKDIRTTIFGLRQPLDSLRGQVHQIVEDYADVLGFHPALRTYGPLDLTVPPQVGDHLLAVLREALSNVARHARSGSAEVEVVVDRDTLTLTVVDSGIGIPAERVESGLRNVQERANILGGTLQVLPNVGPGTTLTWTVRLP